MWRWTLGSSPTPGQPLMAQGGLDFQSGWSHEVLQYLWSAQSSAGPMCQPPCRCVHCCRPLHHAALRLELPGHSGSHPSSSSSLTFLVLAIRIKPPSAGDLPGQCLAPGTGSSPSKDKHASSPHDMCATWQCLCLILLLPHSPALCHTAGSPLPMQPTPKRRTLKLLLPLVRGAEHGNLRC